MPSEAIKESIDYMEKAARLARRFREDAVERDKVGGTPKEQRDWIRESGLLKLLIPRSYGGFGLPWSAVLRVVREFARTDAALAHVYGYHFLSLSSVHLAGTEEQQRYYYTETAKYNYFWGNSVNPLDNRTFGERTCDGVIVNGRKSFSSGSPDSDMLVIAWKDQETRELRKGIVPTDRPGVIVHDDWDCMGQRQTGSGTVSFHNLKLHSSEILERAYMEDNAFSTLTPILSQSILASVFVGSALGALEEARQYTKTEARAWYRSGVENASDEPSTLSRYGQMWTNYQAALSLVEKAAVKLDETWEKGVSLTDEERGECAVLVAAANVQAGNTALDITSRIFEVMGARSTASRYGFDRFWRNVRTHTLHNPAEFKLRNVGNWFVNREWPEPGYYS
ncbi:acyl-CoA dehydrogenase family protein [Alicyclobacillus kakegawensis]|uniref:acyl-CoA dehydrogenase family protein n=1 Tax=Alicyclobacillus kakegawensis TaxID=392012 RepID=UPI000835EB3A|nr:acyl-CoA dehydrogenase family protein [Alicyclobacillus kakegawensis]